MYLIPTSKGFKASNDPLGKEYASRGEAARVGRAIADKRAQQQRSNGQALHRQASASHKQANH